MVALEACGGAHHWGRELSKLGHTVRLIPPAYVSSVPYEAWNCKQLGDEQYQLADALGRASTQQETAHSNDVVGVLLIGLPVSSMSGENIAPQIAHLKSQQEAVRLAAARNSCS